jgi:hypothetical protein
MGPTQFQESIPSPHVNPSKNFASVDKTTRYPLLPKNFKDRGIMTVGQKRGVESVGGRGKFFESLLYLIFSFFSGRDSTGEPVHF